MFTPVAVHTGTHRLGGVTRPGESWAAAATRIAGRPAYAVDLSGEVKEFSSDPMPVVALRPMTRGDLPHLIRWLNAEHVHHWYAVDGEPTPEWVTENYGPDIDGKTPVTFWVIEVNGRSIGFCQDYRISDEPDYALLTPDPDAIGFDYAIGEPAFVGRGIGPRMAWVWLTSIPRRYPGATACFAAPDHRNAASLRMLAKVGFEQGTWFDEPQPDGSTTTMVGCSLDLRRVLG
ncbi:GNAT family N-acetyltransferase [Nocardioides sp. NPDC004968]|uniref:GNAT family N-acetyltransferase n=1 Tax=Nocardioides sp. NPDC004968 TaxID=3155894 RepID=UPI0033BF671B